MTKSKEAIKEPKAPSPERIYYFPTLNRSVKAASLDEARKKVAKKAEVGDDNI